jgi:hypothetical protein
VPGRQDGAHQQWITSGRQCTREGDLGEKILIGGARAEGGWLIGGVVRAPGPTGRGAERVGRCGPASCGGLGRHREFGPRRRNSFSFSKEFSNF